MRSFFAGKFIEKEKLKEAGINYPIKLEYYKKINKDENLKDGICTYGILVVKTAYHRDNVTTEYKEIQNVSKDEKQIERILSILKENEVTPISVDDILSDLSKMHI